MGPNERYLVELIRRYGLYNRSKEARNALRLFESGRGSELVARAYLLRFQPLIQQLERRPNFLFRPPEFDELYPAGPPPVILGCLEEAEEIPLGVFPKGAFHCLFVGSSGCGKSVAIRRLVFAIEEAGRQLGRQIIIIILDYKGGTFANFPKLLGGRWRLFDVHGELKLGLQPPAGVPVQVWINYLVTSFCSRAGLVASWVTMANLLRWLVAVMNPVPTDRLLFPDFQAALDAAHALPKKAFAEKVPYLESLIQYLEGVTKASGNLFRTFNGLDLERDLISPGLSAVISVANLSPPWLNQFIADLFVLQLLLGRLHRPHRVDDPEVLLILDDCDAVVSRDNERRFVMDIPPLVRGLRQFRELGVGVCLGVGAMSFISEQVLNSIAHHFVFRNPHDDCAEAGTRALGIPRGNQRLIQALEPGECIVKLSGLWPHAMLGRIDFVPPCRDFTCASDANPHVPAQRIGEIPAFRQALEQLKGQYLNASQRQEEKRYGKLCDDSRQLLMLASVHPYWPVVRLFDLMDEPSPLTKKAVLVEIRNHYAELARVRIGRKNLCLIWLKDAAWCLLGKPPLKARGGGGLAHRTVANWILMVGRKRGYEVAAEWVVPGTNHAADAAWSVEGRWHTFEIVITCATNLEAHLDAMLLAAALPVESVTIVVSQKAILRQMKQQVQAFAKSASYLDRVRFEVMDTFEGELWPR